MTIECPDDVYVSAALAQQVAWRPDEDPAWRQRIAERMAEDPPFRVAIDVAYRAGYVQGRDAKATGDSS